jgi:hypothetical protein
LFGIGGRVKVTTVVKVINRVKVIAGVKVTQLGVKATTSS